MTIDRRAVKRVAVATSDDEGSSVLALRLDRPSCKALGLSDGDDPMLPLVYVAGSHDGEVTKGQAADLVDRWSSMPSLSGPVHARVRGFGLLGLGGRKVLVAKVESPLLPTLQRESADQVRKSGMRPGPALGDAFMVLREVRSAADVPDDLPDRGCWVTFDSLEVLGKGYEDQPRDELGRFGEGGGAGAAEGEAAEGEAAEGEAAPTFATVSATSTDQLPSVPSEELAEKMIRDGGFTYNPVTGNSPTSGKAVAAYPEAETKVSADELDASIIEQFYEEHSSIFEEDEHAHLGGWIDEGTAYLDISALYDDIDEAMEVAKQHGEKAIFDLDTMEDVRVDDDEAAEGVERAEPGEPEVGRFLLGREDLNPEGFAEAVEGVKSGLRKDDVPRDEFGRFAETGGEMSTGDDDGGDDEGERTSAGGPPGPSEPGDGAGRSTEEMRQQGDVHSEPMPEGKYNEGDPRNDPGYEKHVNEVIERSDEIIERDGDTQYQHTLPTGMYDDKGKEIRRYTEDRKQLHRRIIDDYIAQADERAGGQVPQEYKALTMGGLPGAGKSTYLREHGQGLGGWLEVDEGGDPANAVVVNPDEFKQAILDHMEAEGELYEGLTKGEHAAIVHEESSDVAERATRQVLASGRNVVFDVTLGSSPEKMAEKYSEAGLPGRAGYEADGVFVDADMATSLHSAGMRHKNVQEDGTRKMDGRLVPYDLMEEQRNTEGLTDIDGNEAKSTNRATFDQLAQEGAFGDARVNDRNSGDVRQIAERGESANA